MGTRRSTARPTGHETVTEQLIAARCNVDLWSKNDFTSLQAASEKGEGAKQGAAERKEAEGAGTSQGMQVRGLSQEKDDDDGLPDESPARRESTSKEKRAGDQGASVSKTAPWATEAKEAGAAAAGVGVESKSWPPPLQARQRQVWAWNRNHGLHPCRQLSCKHRIAS